MNSKRGGAALPIFLLALLAQLLAPVWAGVGMAHAAHGAAPICIASAAASPPDAPAHETPVSHDDCCAACHFVQSGVGAPPTAWEFVAPALRPGYADWTYREMIVLGLSGRFDVQARAPPSLS